MIVSIGLTTLNYCYTTTLSICQLETSINSLKLNKSSGPDGIISEMIKNTTHDISPILLSLYNNILNSGVYPTAWSESILCLLYKSGSMNDTNNFRGISLIDILNTILTGMMKARLYSWSEEHKHLHEAQSGFRKGYYTIDNLFTLMAMSQKYLSKKRC